MAEAVTPWPHRVHYHETDPMGFAHHSHYLRWFENARTEMLRQAGESYRQWEAEGYLLPVLRCSIEFGPPLRYDDPIEVHPIITQVTRLRLNFRYEIRRPGEKTPVTTGLSEHCFMGPNGRPRRIPPERLAMLERYLPQL